MKIPSKWWKRKDILSLRFPGVSLQPSVLVSDLLWSGTVTLSSLSFWHYHDNVPFCCSIYVNSCYISAKKIIVSGTYYTQCFKNYLVLLPCNGMHFVVMSFSIISLPYVADFTLASFFFFLLLSILDVNDSAIGTALVGSWVTSGVPFFNYYFLTGMTVHYRVPRN